MSIDIATLDSVQFSSGITVSRRSFEQPSETSKAEPVAVQTQQAPRQAEQSKNNPPQTSLKEEDIQKHLSKINEFLDSRNSDVQFTVDKDTGMRVVKVIDHATKETIRQFPTEEAIKIAKALDNLQGLLIRQKA